MRSRAALGAFVVAGILAACQSPAPPAGDQVSRPGDDSALSTMERIAVASQRCWFAGGDRAFAGLALSPELTSFSGKPRILAVPRGNIGGLPTLVVEASGKPARLNAYGPLLDTEHAPRIAADIRRWSAGDSSCTSRA